MYGRSWFSTNRDSTLISYYGKRRYQSHHDTFMWTVLNLVLQTTKIWTGGDLDFLSDTEIQVNFKHNRGILFHVVIYIGINNKIYRKSPKTVWNGKIYNYSFFM